jgi:hypothetical protein
MGLKEHHPLRLHLQQGPLTARCMAVTGSVSYRLQTAGLTS